jgi:hypothetical protein
MRAGTEGVALKREGGAGAGAAGRAEVPTAGVVRAAPSREGSAAAFSGSAGRARPVKLPAR